MGIAIFQGIRSRVLALPAPLLDLYKSETERPPNKQIAILISVINKRLYDMVCDTAVSPVLCGHTRMFVSNITNEIVMLGRGLLSIISMTVNGHNLTKHQNFRH